MTPPPPQRQQARQSPVRSHWQHCLSLMVPVEQGVGHAGEHEVVVLTPFVVQVTCPISLGQLRLAAVQVVPVQLTERNHRPPCR
jgi:hypothetical protein